ncbi:hypothetical protein [uncultured Novosphingobium sp.]|uniref:hypothetical protein n=1 Tax=uncultured Novosphingobium sp. TaxID=292277 RepID=UPI003748D354
MNFDTLLAERKAERVLPSEPLLVDTKTTRALLCIGSTTLFQYLREGVLERRKAGRKTLVTLASIKAFAEG